MKKRTNVDFIINGGLWWTDSQGKSHSLNLLIADGKQNNEGVYSRFGLKTFADNSFKFGWYKYTKDLQGMIGGSPALVIDSKVNIDKGQMENNLISSRQPRSAVGSDDEYFYMVTVDGRQLGMPGMTINGLAKFMLSIGCKYAIAGDGGGTVRMEDKEGLLNSPLENRPCHNAIGIKLNK